MSSILLTAPTVEPVSLAEAKAYLRVEHSDDDELIGALIAGSRVHVEAQTRRALVTQSWRISADAWPEDGRLTVVPGPLQVLTAARVYDFEGLAHDVDVQAFVPDRASKKMPPWVPACVVTPLQVSLDHHGSPCSFHCRLRGGQRRRGAGVWFMRSRFPGVD